MDYEEKIKALEEELQSTKQELQATKDHLKKYTAPTRNKKYYHENKEKIKQKQYAPSIITPEQRKEYNKRAYQKRKGKNETDENV
tara:strand:- start:392 stop:646 length:255 start_codon:yes stop_codon:yes gene_type:complete